MDVKTQVINARNSGWTYSQIQEEYGIPKSTARGWVDKFDAGIEYTPLQETLNFGTPYVNDNLQRVKPARFQKNEQDVLEFLAQLAPLKYDTVSRQTHVDFTNYVVVLNDMHFPKHCQKSLDIALETISRIQPKQIILNGDTVDMLAVSRFPKDIRHNYSLLDEREAYQSFLRDLIEVSNGTEIIETHSNHSGGGTAGRWFRYLSERLGELGCLPDIQEKLSYENVFLGDFQDYVIHADYVEVCPDLVVMHGDVVRKNGGASARGMIDKYFQSIIMGHTHRVGMTAQRMPGLGSKQEKQLFSWELGCLCDLNPIYASAPNWQNAFGIISVSDDGSYGVEPVMINNGKANIATLGMTITS
jgi:predicted phosphodiesterase